MTDRSPEEKLLWDIFGEEPLNYEDGFHAGYLAAVGIFQRKFFGGPTKDMVLRWFEAEMPLSPGAVSDIDTTVSLSDAPPDDRSVVGDASTT